METRHVAIGGDDVLIDEPTVLKAELALGLVTAIYEQIPDLNDRIDDYISAVRKREALPRATAEARYPEACANISEEGWKEAGQKLELPIMPGPREIFAQQIPTLTKLARGEVMRLLALISTSSELLHQAEESGGDQGVSALLDERSKALRRATIREIAELADVTVSIVREEFGGGDDEGKLTGLRTIWTSLFGVGQEAQTPSASSPEDVAESAIESSPSSSASPNGDSSSGPPFIGAGAKSSDSASEKPASTRSE